MSPCGLWTVTTKSRHLVAVAQPQMEPTPAFFNTIDSDEILRQPSSEKVRMDDLANLDPPPILEDLIQATKKTGFKLASEPLTGSLLRTLAASKPSGKFLEIGTGTGIGTAWLLAGMDQNIQFDLG